MSKVTFDYSKAKTFISDHEIASMKKIAENAKRSEEHTSELQSLS